MSQSMSDARYSIIRILVELRYRYRYGRLLSHFFRSSALCSDGDDLLKISFPIDLPLAFRIFIMMEHLNALPDMK